jgi:hypothetical protein
MESMRLNRNGKPYWNDDIAQRYEWMGAPLRPSAEHIQFLETAIASLAGRGSEPNPKALLLGITPDIVRMRWPETLFLIGMDNSWPMVHSLWAGSIPGRRAVVCGDWLAPAFPDELVDMVVGDGSVNALRSCGEAHRLAANVSSILKSEGTFLLRCYLQPPIKEQPEEVFEAMHRGEISSCHHFRLRLLMAVQHDTHKGVSLAEVHRHWANRDVLGRLPSGVGWEKQAVDLIEFYAGSETRYWFPTLPQLREILSEHFDEEAIHFGSGELGERCPTLQLRTR